MVTVMIVRCVQRRISCHIGTCCRIDRVAEGQWHCAQICTSWNYVCTSPSGIVDRQTLHHELHLIGMGVVLLAGIERYWAATLWLTLEPVLWMNPWSTIWMAPWVSMKLGVPRLGMAMVIVMMAMFHEMGMGTMKPDSMHHRQQH